MSLFKTLVKETKEIDENRIDTRDYEEYRLNDLEADETFRGEPFLTQIYENEFEDINTGEMVKKYSANLYITNHENEEKLKARVNLKGLQDDITAWKGSVVYDIIDSLEELEGNEPGTDNIYKISYAELQEILNGLSEVNVKVIAHTGDFIYNTLRIIEANGE